MTEPKGDTPVTIQSGGQKKGIRPPPRLNSTMDTVDGPPSAGGNVFTSSHPRGRRIVLNEDVLLLSGQISRTNSGPGCLVECVTSSVTCTNNVIRTLKFSVYFSDYNNSAACNCYHMLWQPPLSTQSCYLHHSTPQYFYQSKQIVLSE